MIKSVLTVGGYTILSRVFGLIREILFSHYLGASPLTDAFFVAFKFPNFFRRLFAEGAFNAAFVPLFSRQLASEGAEAAKKTAQDVFAAMAVFLTVFVLIVVVFAPAIIHILAPGFATTPEKSEMTVLFIRITFPYILFISLAAHLSGVLNSLDRFAAAAGVPIILNVVMILGLWVTPHTSVNPGLVLCSSVFVAGVLQFLWLYGYAAHLGFFFPLKWPQLTPAVRELLRLMGPGIIGAGVMNINFFVDTIVASYLPEKSVSFLYYADRLNQLPLSVFGIAVGTALLPTLSKYLRTHQYGQATQTQTLAIEFSLSVALPAAVGLIFLAHPIICVIYGLSAQDTLQTAKALQGFAIGIPAYVLNKIFTAHFFARQDTKTPVKVGIVTIFLNILFTLSLMGPLGHVGLALATALSAWVNVILLYSSLYQRAWYYLPRTSWPFLIKVTVACGVMSFGLAAAQTLMRLQGILNLMYLMTCGMSIFIIVGLGLGTFNKQVIRRAFMKKGGK